MTTLVCATGRNNIQPSNTPTDPPTHIHPLTLLQTRCRAIHFDHGKKELGMLILDCP